jgi:hypothetical protein
MNEGIIDFSEAYSSSSKERLQIKSLKFKRITVPIDVASEFKDRLTEQLTFSHKRIN